MPRTRKRRKKESMNIDDVGNEGYENVKRKVHHWYRIKQLRIKNNPNIELIRADNKEKEILACFEMIAKHLKVPTEGMRLRKA